MDNAESRLGAPDQEAEIRREVAELAVSIKDTRQLIRETAALIFFRYGENPSGNRVRQLTNRGSMVTVHDEIKNFWADVRKRLKVRITHPEIPAELLDAFSTVAAQVWENAQNLARDSLSDHRMEADKAVEEARQGRIIAEEAMQRAVSAADAANTRREETEKQLAAEQAARAETLAEVERWRQQTEQCMLDLEKARGVFQAETEKLTASLDLAQLQYRDMEKRMMLEVDATRTRLVEIREMLQKRESELTISRETERTIRSSLRQSQTENTELVAQCAELKGRQVILSEERDRLTGRLEEANRQAMTLAELEGRLVAITEERDALRNAKAEQCERDVMLGESDAK